MKYVLGVDVTKDKNMFMLFSNVGEMFMVLIRYQYNTISF